MSVEHDGGSMYDFAGDNYQAPAQAEPVETPHQNRPHGVLKYENNLQFQQKVDAAPTDSAPKTSARYEWGLLIANRDSNNHVALKVNLLFVRNSITGDNFKSEKARYLSEYEKLLMNGYK